MIGHSHLSLSPTGDLVWLAVASFLAGLLNSVAGGGSFFSFPAMLAMGIPPIAANATNTVALWPGQFTSIAAYRKDFGGNRALLPLLSVAALLGGLGGGVVLLHTGQGTFLRMVPWLLLSAATLFAFSSHISDWLKTRTRGVARPDEAELERSVPRLPLFLGMLFTTLYIGFFGAGAGFLIMALLALFGVENVTQINALKVVTTTLANGAAVVLFIVQGQVLWHYCLIMMLTGALGGYLGGRGARRVNPRWMRHLVTAVGYSMAAFFFWRDGF